MLLKTVASITLSTLSIICCLRPTRLGQTSHHIGSSPMMLSGWEALISLIKNQEGTEAYQQPLE